MNPIKEEAACACKLRAAKDAMDMLQGKWRLPIILSLSFGHKRFGEIRRDIEDISPKMLTQELEVPEANKLVSRTLNESSPATAEYALTRLGHSLQNLIGELLKWGSHFRSQLLAKV